jgi:hypothetical protein
VATGFLQFPLESVATANLRRCSNPMPITVPNYNCKTDRFQFGMLIDMTSES